MNKLYKLARRGKSKNLLCVVNAKLIHDVNSFICRIVEKHRIL
jgi:hypothetical protein